MKQLQIKGQTLAGILPTIISGLYNDKFDIIREYCQNSYDAILAKYRSDGYSKGKIEISIQGTSISIHDNGIGMDSEVVSKLATIGYSTKDTMDQVGYRGIGRLSGICGAKSIHFVTKSASEDLEHFFEIDAQGLSQIFLDREKKFSLDAGELLAKYSKHKAKTVEGQDRSKSYTTVLLNDINVEAGKLLDETKLREYLEINLPLPISPALTYAKHIDGLYSKYDSNFPNIFISINGKQMFKPFHLLDGINTYDSLILNDNLGNKIAVAWYIWNTKNSKMIEDERLRGIRFRYKGFCVGTAGDMRNIMQTAPPQVPEWFAGEVIVLNKEVQVSSDRSRFEDNIQRSRLYHAMKDNLGKTLTDVARRRSAKRSRIMYVESVKKDLRIIDSKLSNSKIKSREELKIHEAKTKSIIKDALGRTKKAYDTQEISTLHSILREGSELLGKINKEITNSKGLEKYLNPNSNARVVYDKAIEEIKKHCSRCERHAEVLSRIEKSILKMFEEN